MALPMRTGSSVQIVGHLGEESAPPPPDWPPEPEPEPACPSERGSAVGVTSGVITSHPSAGGGAPALGGVCVEALASQDALPALGLGKPLQLAAGKKKLKQPFGAPLAHP